MKILPRFFVWVLLLISVWLAGHFGLWSWMQLCLVFFLLLPVFSWLGALVTRSRIGLESMSAEAMIDRGETARWRLKIDNRNLSRSAFLEGSFLANSEEEAAVFNHPLTIGPRESKILTLEIPSIHCGRVYPHAFRLRILDSFGFSALPLWKSDLSDFEEVWALPRNLVASEHAEEASSLLDSGDHISHKSETEIDEIDRMRAMQPGDRMRSIHWKLSARMQSWMVRQYEKADEAQLTILLDPPQIPARAHVKEREALLCLRDALLDSVSANCQAFLNYDFKLRLKTRMPEPLLSETHILAELNMLRLQLARMPWEKTVTLAEQLEDELEQPGHRFYCIFTTEMSEDCATSLKLLSARSSGVILELLCQDGETPPAWRNFLRELAQEGVRVRLRRYRRGGGR